MCLYPRLYGIKTSVGQLCDVVWYCISDGEFEPTAGSSDDEETIAREEELNETDQVSLECKLVWCKLLLYNCLFELRFNASAPLIWWNVEISHCHKIDGQVWAGIRTTPWIMFDLVNLIISHDKCSLITIWKCQSLYSYRCGVIYLGGPLLTDNVQSVVGYHC